MPTGFIPGYPVPRSQWVEKGDSCPGCGKRFTFFTSKANCPHCGRLYCSDCLQAECTIVPGGQPVQTCLSCFSMLQDFKRRQLAAHEERQMQQSISRDKPQQPPTPSPDKSSRAASVAESRAGSTTGASSAAAGAVSAAVYAEVKQQLSELMAKSQELRRENEELLRTVNLKDDVIASATGALQTEKGKNERLEKQYRDMELKHKESQREATEMGKQVEKLKLQTESQELHADQRRAYESEIDQLRRALQEMTEREDRQNKEETENIEARVAAATKTLEDRVRELQSRLQETVRQAESEKEGLRGELQKANDALAEKVSELAEAVARAAEEKELRGRYDAELAEVREQLSRNMSQLEELNQKTTEDARESIALLERELSAAAEQKTCAEEALAAAEGRCADLQRRLAEAESGLQHLRDTTSQNQEARAAEVAAMERQKEALEKRLAVMEGQQARGESDSQDRLDADLERRRAMEQDIASLQEKVNALEQEKLSLQEDKRRTEEATAQSVAETEKYRQLLEQTAVREKEGAGEAAALSHALALEQDKAKKAEMEVQELQAQCATLQRNVAGMVAAKEKAQVEDAVTDKTAADAKETKKLRGMNRQLTQELQEARDALKAKEDEMKLLRDQNNVGTEKRKELSKTIKELRQAVSNLTTEREQAESALREERKSAGEALRLARAEQEKLTEQLNAAKEETVHLTAEGKAIRSALGADADVSLTDITPPWRDGTSRWRQLSIVQPVRYRVPEGQRSHCSSVDALPDGDRLFTWGYDIAGAAEKVPSILQTVANAAADRLHLFDSPSDTGAASGESPRQRWQAMTALVEANYRDNPYHKATHAADVVQGLCAILLSPGNPVAAQMTRTEKRAAVFAAMVHDVRHPGRTRDFLRKTFDPLYFHYNGKSVLEQMHTATAFALLSTPETDFTTDMSDDEVLDFHHMVASMVGVTDMAVHNECIAEWRKKTVEKRYDFSRAEDRLDALGLFLHAADIGAQAKGVPVALRWVTILEEMYQQGDEEKARGLRVSMGCQRPMSESGSSNGSTSQDAGQLFFLRTFVVPMYQLVAVLVPSLTAPMQELHKLYTFYGKRCGDTNGFPESLVVGSPSQNHPSVCESGGELVVSTSPTQTDRASTVGGPALADQTAMDDAAQRVREQARALRDAYGKVKAAAKNIAAREAALGKREDALFNLEARVVDGLREMSMGRGAGEGRSDGPAAGAAESSVEDTATTEVEEKLLRTTARLVERERHVRKRAEDLEKQAADLEERERLAAALSDQLAAIAERVNHQRRKLARREAQYARGPQLPSSTMSSAALSLSAKQDSFNDTPRAVALCVDRETVVDRLTDAIQRLTNAVTYAA